jgi:hypothetical protein
MANSLRRFARAVTGTVLVLGLVLVAAPMTVAAPAPIGPKAAEFPAAFHGLWFSGASCDQVDGYVITGGNFQLFGALSPRGDGKYMVGRQDTDIIVAAAPDRLVTRGVREAPTPQGAVPSQIVSEIKNGRRSFYWQDEPAKQSQLFHCDKATPRDPRAGDLLIFLGRVDALDQGYATIAAACRNAQTAPGPCGAAIVRFLDVNGDGKLSPAEITTFLRRYAPVAVLLNAGHGKGRGMGAVDPVALAGVEAATAMFGPFLTNVIFSNFDLDGNGFLTADELVLALKEEAATGGTIDTTHLLDESRKQLEDAMAGMRGLAQMLGMPSHAPGMRR